MLFLLVTFFLFALLPELFFAPGCADAASGVGRGGRGEPAFFVRCESSAFRSSLSFQSVIVCEISLLSCVGSVWGTDLDLDSVRSSVVYRVP